MFVMAYMEARAAFAPVDGELVRFPLVMASEGAGAIPLPNRYEVRVTLCPGVEADLPQTPPVRDGWEEGLPEFLKSLPHVFQLVPRH